MSEYSGEACDLYLHNLLKADELAAVVIYDDPKDVQYAQQVFNKSKVPAIHVYELELKKGDPCNKISTDEVRPDSTPVFALYKRGEYTGTKVELTGDLASDTRMLLQAVDNETKT